MVGQGRWRARERELLGDGRHAGSVLEWRGHFGWIAPDNTIDHPEASKHGWRVYVNARDVDGGGPLHGGTRVSFLAYTDGDGVGAESVTLEEDDGESSEDFQESDDANAWSGGGGQPCGKVGRWATGRVQRTIEKWTPGDALGKGKEKGKAKGKLPGKLKGKGGKDGGKTRAVVLLPGPGSGPNREKETKSGGDGGALSWASSEMQGWRPAMEDATRVVLDLGPPLETHALFGVFDGHGGATVSRRTAEELPGQILACAGNAPPEHRLDPAGRAEFALKTALPALDSVLREEGAGMPGFLATCGAPIVSDVENAYGLTGSTAVVALVECEGPPEASRPLRITVANCGDSRAMVCRGGTAIPLSEDQKPECPVEKARIEAAGGFVGQVGPCQRIDGWGLNLSRALGDFHYKAREDLPYDEQKVVAVPEIRSCELEEQDEFLLLCCDGVFELKSNQEAVDHVRGRLQEGWSLTDAVEDLVDSCCSPNLAQTQNHGSDNVSAMVVLLQ